MDNSILTINDFSQANKICPKCSSNMLSGITTYANNHPEIVFGRLRNDSISYTLRYGCSGRGARFDYFDKKLNFNINDNSCYGNYETFKMYSGHTYLQVGCHPSYDCMEELCECNKNGCQYHTTATLLFDDKYYYIKQ